MTFREIIKRLLETENLDAEIKIYTAKRDSNQMIDQKTEAREFFFSCAARKGFNQDIVVILE